MPEDNKDVGVNDVLVDLNQTVKDQSQTIVEMAREGKTSTIKETRIEGATSYDADMERIKSAMVKDLVEKGNTTGHDVEIEQIKADALQNVIKAGQPTTEADIDLLRVEQGFEIILFDKEHQADLDKEEREEKRKKEQRLRKKEEKTERKAELAAMNPISRFITKHGGTIGMTLVAVVVPAGIALLPVIIKRIKNALED